jgi:hypothetical protein
MEDRSQQQNQQQQGGSGRQADQDQAGSAAQASGITGESNVSGQPQQTQGGISGLGDSDQARSGGQAGGQQGGIGSGQEYPQDNVRGSQQGGQNDSGQQRQFDSHGGGQQGGGGSDGRFTDQIREHMEVVDDRGSHVGTVDHVDGDRIKLARSDSSDGQHHYVQLSQVAGIEGDKIRLRERGDNDFGQQSG